MNSSADPNREPVADFAIGDWIARPNRLVLERGAQQRKLEPKVMEVLVALAETAGAVRSKEELLDAVWSETYVADGVLLRSISELRRALDDDARNPRYIETIPKRGYRLIASVDLAPLATPPEPGPEVASRRVPSPVAVADGESRSAARVALIAAPFVVLLLMWLGLDAMRSDDAPSDEPAPAAPNQNGDLLERAHAFARQGSPTAVANAIELYKRVLERTPELAEAYAGLAVSYVAGVRHGRDPAFLGAALEASESAVELDRQSAAAHHARGVVLAEVGRWRSGLAALRRAVDIDSRRGEAWLDLGRTHVLAGDLQEGVRCLRRSVELDGDQARVHAELARAYRLLGASEQAAAAAARSLVLEPLGVEALLLKAQLSIDQDGLITARDQLNRLLESFPDHARVLNLAGTVEERLGHTDRARALFRSALGAGARAGMAELRLAALLATTGTSEEDIGELHGRVAAQIQADLDSGSEAWHPLVLRAGLAVSTGDLDTALSSLGEASRAGFRDPAALESDPLFAPLLVSEDFQSWAAELRVRVAEVRRRMAS